jgi:hypothetical protein
MTLERTSGLTDEVRAMETASAEVLEVGRPSTHPREVWIIVCEHFHGAVGPIPTERLAVGLAAYASQIGACTYRPVRFALAEQRKVLPRSRHDGASVIGRGDDERLPR